MTSTYLVDASRRILLVRGRNVILDADLAWLYGATTKALNQAVSRNSERFPSDFVFRLTARERDEVVTNCDHLRRLRFSPTRPYAFTEHGAVMAANVLKSPRAVRASIFVVRAFNRTREALASHQELAGKLAELERKLTGHDHQIQSLIQAMRALIVRPMPKRARIGFQPP